MWQSWQLTPALRRRAVAILIPDDLELDAQVDGNLMAADAELRLGDLAGWSSCRRGCPCPARLGLVLTRYLSLLAMMSLMTLFSPVP